MSGGETSRGWSRRDFLKLSGVAGAAFVVPGALFTSRAVAASPLVGAAYFDSLGFSEPLPLPRRVRATVRTMDVDIVEFEHQVLSESAGYPKTRLWGYQFPGTSPSWPGATIVAARGIGARFRWRNLLPRGDQSLMDGAHLLPFDETLHTATAHMGIPVVTHLHGGHTEAGSDGYPEAWFTQGYAMKGPNFQEVYRYANDQEAGTCWYHDHALGITRLNVYAGLAGFYLVRDAHELALGARGVLPSGAYEVELGIQDRGFTDDGQLLLPTDTQVPDGIAATIFPDFMCVNGKPWPYLEVEPRKYRFRLLNGSDSRFLILRLDHRGTTLPLLRAGTDLGLSDEAVQLDRLLVSPAERYDLVVDFSDLAGEEIVLKNEGVDGPLRGFRDTSGNITNDPSGTPFTFGPATGPSPDRRTSEVMQFRVSRPLSRVRNASVAAGTRLRPGGGSLPKLKESHVRKVVLLSGSDVVLRPDGTERTRVMELQGALAKADAPDYEGGGTFAFFEPVTETPKLGAVEVWEIYNYTVPPDGLAHPIHLHLVHFQVVNRQSFRKLSDTGQRLDVDKPHPMGPMTHGEVVRATGKYLDPDLVELIGDPRAPEPYEQGWKDTVVCYGGEVTRVIAKFDRPGLYVWHCHLLHHEDHDMMRPFLVGR